MAEESVYSSCEFRRYKLFHKKVKKFSSYTHQIILTPVICDN